MPVIDTVIIGAGPAGSAAAITLGRAGLETVLVDKATFPRDKCCGDGLTTLALRELESLGLRPESVASWQPLDTAVLRSPSGRTARLPIRHDAGTHAAVTSRAELDAAVLDLAITAGAEPILGEKITGIATADDSVTAILSNGRRITARYLIAADGIWSPTRKLLGLQPNDYRGDWIAFRQYFATAEPASRDLWVFFEPDLLPGYAWSFPLPDGRVNVGFGVLRASGHSGAETKQIWDGLMQRETLKEVLGTKPEAIGRHRALPIPAHLGKVPVQHGRVFFVGDAAAATDPMSGEGIGQALVSGRLAAEAVEANEPARYGREVNKELMADHRFARLLSHLIAKPRVVDAAVRALDLNDWTRRNAGRWLFEDYSRAHLAKPRDWHRGAMSAPGAYQPE